MISIDSPGWWNATTQQPDWIPLIMTKQSVTAAEHVFNFYAQSPQPTSCMLSKRYSPPQSNFKYEKGIRANEVFMLAHLAAVWIQTADIRRMCTDLCSACWIAWIEMYTPCALPAWWGLASELPSCQVCVGCILLTALSLYFALHLPPRPSISHRRGQGIFLCAGLCMCVCACKEGRKRAEACMGRSCLPPQLVVLSGLWC